MKILLNKINTRKFVKINKVNFKHDYINYLIKNYKK